MCNEFRRLKALAEIIEEFSSLGLPLFRWKDGAIPNTGPQPSLRIRDAAAVVGLAEGRAQGRILPWAWLGPHGAPVFNFRAEGRDFARAERVLVPADGFYEYTAPAGAGVKLKDRHLFTLAGEPWFWIAGLVREGCFTLLTVPPGPDVAPYHDRQIVVLDRLAGLDWLTLARPQADILRAPAAGGLVVRTLRRDGVEQAA